LSANSSVSASRRFPGTTKRVQGSFESRICPMSENFSEDRHFGGRRLTTISMVARGIRYTLAACTGTLLCCLSGCATSMPVSAKDQFDRGVDTVVRPFHPTYGTISLKELTPDYQPKPSRPPR